jgi:hypothetical protein
MTARSEKPLVEIDEAAMEQRRADTAAWLEDATNQAAMAEGKRALELEMADADKRKRRRQADVESDPALDDAEPDLALGAEPDTALDTSWVETVSVTEVELAPVWSAPAKMALKPADPDDAFSVGEVLEVTAELFDKPEGYVLVIVRPDGERDELPPVETRDGWAAAAAYRGVRISGDADMTPLNALPLEHPVKERRRLAQLRRIERLNENRPASEVRSPREIYRDRDARIGEFASYSDGSSTWW